MNTLLPHEEALRQQLEDLPAPNEDASWQKMKALLDKDDRRVAPPFYNKLWMLLALLLLISGGLFIYSQKKTGRGEVKAENNKNENKVPVASTADIVASSENKAVAENTAVANDSKRVTTLSPDGQQTNTDIDEATTPSANSTELTANNKQDQPQSAQSMRKASQRSFAPLSGSSQSLQLNELSVSKAPIASSASVRKTTKRRKANIKESVIAAVTTPATNDAVEVKKDEENGKVLTIANTHILAADSAPVQPKRQLATAKTEAKKEEATKQTTATPQTPKRHTKKFFVSAGVGLQQSIPIGGQQAVKYNFNGKENTLSDYIPSAWLHLERENKWFVQTEFNYSSPQLVKDLAFSKLTTFDNNTRDLTVTTLRLRKTYYNEIPFSFNYYLQRNWSLGIGGIYSWYRSAIVEKEIVTKNVDTQEQMVKMQIDAVKHYTDSFLYKSHTYLLFQTDYQWRRFSFGLRYTRDVQPYIRYTLPDGMKNDEKNWSLELLVRFRLWKSGLF